MKTLSQMVQEEYADPEVTIPLEEMPEYTVVILAEVDPIPPLQEKDIRFDPEDQKLEQTFREWLLPTQEKNLPHTTYGIFTSIIY